VRCTFRCDGKLLCPEHRRRAVTILQERYRASERLVLPSDGAALQHTTPLAQVRLDRGGKAVASSPRDRRRSHPLGPADSLPPAAARGLEREPHTGATALAGGGPAAAHLQEAQASPAPDGSVRRHRAEHPQQV
jgi:hypothetical protein